jgi:peptidoglycan/xylan/chitin deacetylase (PgdA/CDA1 family)
MCLVGGSVHRRQFLGGTIVSVAGLAAGGTALGASRRGRARQERDNSVLPDGLNHDLGCRQLIWSVPTSQPLAALTFDDGPDLEFTPRILGVLARYGVRATFNVMGYNAIRHRDLIRALVDDGHELGNHTWSHEDLAFQSPAATARQLDRALAAIEQIAGVRPRFFRPPRGELTGTAVQTAARLSHDILLWSVTRGPAGVATPAAVADHLATAVGPGDVVGLHDGIGRSTFDRGTAQARILRARRQVELAALPAAIERLLARNLRLVTASALLDAPRHPEDQPPPAGTASGPGRQWTRISSR